MSETISGSIHRNESAEVPREASPIPLSFGSMADITDHFENEIKAGRMPHIGDYLDHASDSVDREELRKHLAGLLDDYASRRGARLGRYEVLERLGSGGMGVVYLARDTSPTESRGEVALKRILDSLIGKDPKILRRFRIEFAIAKELKTVSGIVPVYEVENHGDLHYYTMKYVNGRDLDAWAAEHTSTGKRPPIDRVVDLIHSVASAVHQVHSDWGIIHRDFKPANILVEYGSDFPWIVDFGLARRLGDGGGMTAAGEKPGTPLYMAPEQVSAKYGGVGPGTDIYGLGAVLYRLLTGETPLIDSGSGLVTRSAIIPLRRHNPVVDADLEAICLKCLERDPRDRYATAKELARDLECWKTGQKIAARRTGNFTRIARSVRRHPEAVVRLGMASLILIACGIAFGLHAANQNTEKLNERINTSFSEARKAIGRILDLAAELRDLPGSAHVRDEFAKAALAYYEEVGKTEDGQEVGKTRDKQTELAAVYERSMKTLGELGRYDEALERGDKAIYIYSGLHAGSCPKSIA